MTVRHQFYTVSPLRAFIPAFLHLTSHPFSQTPLGVGAAQGSNKKEAKHNASAACLDQMLALNLVGGRGQAAGRAAGGCPR